MTEHLPLILGAVAVLAIIAALLYAAPSLRDYLIAKRNAADNDAKKVALDILIAMLDDAVKVAVLAVEQTMPQLGPLADGTPASTEARADRNKEKLLQATDIVKKLISGAMIAGTGTVVETGQIADRIEAAVHKLKRGKL